MYTFIFLLDSFLFKLYALPNTKNMSTAPISNCGTSTLQISSYCINVFSFLYYMHLSTIITVANFILCIHIVQLNKYQE